MVIHLYRKLEMKMETERGGRERERERGSGQISRRFGGTSVVKKMRREQGIHIYVPYSNQSD